jgi:hypothetical protein
MKWTLLKRMAGGLSAVALSLPSMGQTAVPMASQAGYSYTESFADVANWTNNFAGGTGANRWAAVGANGTGTVGDGVKISNSTATFVSGSTGGLQRGTGTLILLSTSTSNSCAVDLLVDFTNLNAGTLSFSAASVNNSTGDRDSKLKVFYSTDGTTFTEITGTNLPFTARNNVASSASVSIGLPAALNNVSTARLRFYEYSTTGGATPSGSQPKISIDDVTVTATAIAPTTQATNVSFASVLSTSMTVSWTNGNGTRRAVFMKASAGTITNPADGISYTGSTDWSSKGTQSGSSGYYCIYDGTGSSAALTNLNAGTTYYVQVFEYNSDGTVASSSIGYNTATASGNPSSQATAGGCTAPATQPASLSLTAPGSSEFTATWSAGNGDGTLAVIRATSSSSLAPSNGMNYTADPDINNAGQIDAGNFVIYKSSGTTVTTTNLTAQTEYTVTLYGFNNTGNCYNTTTPPSSSLFTLSNEPQSHTTVFSATAISPTQIDLSFDAASTITNADGYIILQKQAATAATGTPTDASAYSASATIGDATVAAVISNSSATSVSITGLNAATQYFFTIVPYNWDGSQPATSNYYTAATIPSASATTASTSAPLLSTPTVTAITENSATLGVTVTSDGGATVTARGVAWSVTSVNADPQPGDNGVTDVPGTGTTGTFTVNATGLPAGTQVSFKPYAVNAIGTAYGVATTFYTLATPPTSATSSLVFGSSTTSEITLSNWTTGNGSSRIIVARLSSTSRVAPSNGTSYTANSADFTDPLNAITGTGNVVVFNSSSGPAVTISGLTAATSYSFDIYEYNGSGSTSNYYYDTSASGSKATLSAEPTTGAVSISFSSVSGSGFTVSWTSGNGSARLVVVKAGSVVDGVPVDGSTYTSSSTFGSGSEIGTGNYVVYKTFSNTINITGLSSGTTYHVAVYEYNGSSGTENYLVTGVPAGSQLATSPVYYSQGSVDPAVLTNWNTSTTGTGTSPSNFTTPATFIVQGTHSMSTTTTWAFGGTGSILQVSNGGTLTANHAVTIASGATFQIDNGGTYIHNNITAFGGSIFNGTEAFASNSTVVIQTYNSTGPSGVTFGNLTINNTTDAGSLQFSGALTTVNGNFRLQSMFGTREVRLSSGSTVALTVGGNFTVESGILDIAAGTGTNTSRSLSIGGNFSQTGGTFRCTGTSNAATVTMTGPSATWAQTGGTFTNTNINWVIASGASVTLAGNFPIASSRSLVVDGTLDAGQYTIANNGTVGINGIFKTANAAGLTGTGAAIEGGTLSALGSSSTIEYYFHGTQTITPRTDYQNMIVNAAGTKSMTGATAVSGTLECKSGTTATGGYLALGSNGSIVFSGGALTGFDLPGQLNNLTIGNGTTSLTQDLVVTGTLELGDNILDIGSNTLTINGDLSTSTGSIASDGTGSIVIGGNGTLTDALLFDQSTPGTTNRISNFTLNRTVSGSATLGSGLELTGTVTLTNGTLNADGNLLLVSDASGTARIATIPGTADISGNVTCQRYVPSGSVATRRYRMLSSPNASFTFAQLIDDIFVTGQGGAGNGFDASSNNSATCYTYQESTSGGRGWKPVTSLSGGLAAGSGALVFVRGDRTLASPDWYTPALYPSQNAVTFDFSGTGINKGNVSPSLSYTNTGNSDDDGWNLVGNPYPSQIDWALITKNNLAADYYILNPTTGSYESDNGSQYIASGQAFFVQATASSPSITFTESSKVPDAPTGYFKRSTARISLRMVRDAYNSDIAWLEFRPGASKAYSNREDAIKFPNGLINFGFIAQGGSLVQRNAVPPVSGADTFLISATAAPGTYSLSAGGIDEALPVSKLVYLHDSYNHSMVDLRNSPNYAFTITSDPATSGQRFRLIIIDASMLPVEWLSFTGHSVGTSGYLTWITASGRNNSHFLVERSAEGHDFVEVGRIQGVPNNSTPLSYSFTDEGAFARTNLWFYRIRQVDLSGETTLSSMLRIDAKRRAAGIHVSPNPASDQIAVNVAGGRIEIADLSGRILITSGTTTGGKTVIRLTELSPGPYLIRFTDESGTTTFTRFIRK